MRYDMHVHLRVESDADIDKYEMYARMARLDIVGFVIHYSEGMGKRALRDYRDSVESMGIRALAGLELYYPFSTLPPGFDFYIIHFSDITVDADVLEKLKGVIIAHPFSYGMKIDPSSFEIMRKNGIAVECNSAHFSPGLNDFYARLKEIDIAIPFGSDAHSPEVMGAGMEDFMGCFSPYGTVASYLGIQ